MAVDTVTEKADEVITEHAWHNRANWEDDAWEIWELALDNLDDAALRS